MALGPTICTWHTLLEFCTLVNSLIIDEDGVYDPKLTNDRLLLEMKGTFSELELSILRQRSQEALRLKAARGDLHTSVAVGYVRSRRRSAGAGSRPTRPIQSMPVPMYLGVPARGFESRPAVRSLAACAVCSRTGRC